jgi:hypothetical protein
MPHPTPPGPAAQAWSQMEGLVAGGLARSVGVSNFRMQDLEEVAATATIKARGGQGQRRERWFFAVQVAVQPAIMSSCMRISSAL